MRAQKPAQTGALQLVPPIPVGCPCKEKSAGVGISRKTDVGDAPVISGGHTLSGLPRKDDRMNTEWVRERIKDAKARVRSKISTRTG